MAYLSVEKTLDLAEQQYGARYLVDRDTLLIYLNIIQSLAWDQDLDVFVNYDNYLEINYNLTFAAGGYTSAVAGDVGKEVVGTTSGATGTLVSYNNTTKIWKVLVLTGAFLDTEAVTITTGTGAGTLSAVAINRTYSAPSDCRLIQGVTSLTDPQLLYPYPPNGSSLPTLGTNDYGWYGNYVTSFDNDRYRWITGRIDNLSNTYTFQADPEVSSTLYRLIYYKNAPEITSDTDDDNYLIPEINRMSLALSGIGALAENALYGNNTNEVLRPMLTAFWSSIRGNNAPSPGNNYRSVGFSSDREIY